MVVGADEECNGCRWAQRGDMWEASDIMQKMRQEGLTPDVHSYTSFLNACCKAGDMQVPYLIRTHTATFLDGYIERVLDGGVFVGLWLCRKQQRR